MRLVARQLSNLALAVNDKEKCVSNALDATFRAYTKMPYKRRLHTCIAWMPSLEDTWYSSLCDRSRYMMV